MLDELFMRTIDMSKIASVVILFVILARLLLKRAPKIVSYALWTVVLFRLLCPLSLEAPVSIVPDVTPVSQNYSLADEPISVVGAGLAAYRAVGDAFNGGLGVQHIQTTETNENGNTIYVTSNWRDVWILFGQYVWIAGITVLLIYSAVSYWKLQKKLKVVVPLRDNIYIADDIQSPFVMGWIRPKIYLPCGLSEKEQDYILLHEQHHIKRLDHIFKVLAFLALCIHWFNPLVWFAFVLAGKDMEMSCDEAVIRKMGEGVRADYSASLLALATGHRIISGTPLAFGEGDTKGRIKNLSKWKEPVLWVVILAVIACTVLAVCLLTNPAASQEFPKEGHNLTWFDYTENSSAMEGELRIELSEFPGVIFQYNTTQIIASKPFDGSDVTERAILIAGKPIWNAFFTDLTGDGYPELCATLSFGADIIDTRIVVFDYANGVSYEMSDHGYHDFSLRWDEENEQLYVDNRVYPNGELASSGRLVFQDDCIQILYPSNENKTETISPMQKATAIPGVYDFDQDGLPEVVELMTHFDEDNQYTWFELLVKKADGTLLWKEEAHTAHAGYNSLFACTLNGKDYLLQYTPTMYQGNCNYAYRLFALDAQGNILPSREASVSFDLNWESPLHGEFNAAEVADFMEEVNGLLANSKLLLSTDTAFEDLDPQHPQDIPWWLRDKELCQGYLYEEDKTLRENLLELERIVGD